MRSSLRKTLSLLTAVVILGGCSATRTQEAPGEVVDDSLLTAKVKSALIADPVTKARQINVETYRGVVQLGGFVDTADEKAQATKVATGITGVKEVRNDLRVSSPQSTEQGIDDTALTASVKAKLIEDSTTKAYHINVETQKGVVQLTGFVNSTDEKSRAAELARNVDGVVDVKNDLEIRQN